LWGGPNRELRRPARKRNRAARLRQTTRRANHFEFSEIVSSSINKNISVFQKQNWTYGLLVSPDKRGVRTSRTRGGMRWTRAAALTNAAGADGKAVWSWRPDAGVTFAGHFSRTTVAKELGSPGRARNKP